jgi:RNA polymerase sigma factor (TIGR02999 family)
MDIGEIRLECGVPGDSHELTGLLKAWGQGNDAALHQLMPQVERELNRIARRCLFSERDNHSLSATALVNEAFLRLVDIHQIEWQDRAHFLAMSARVMRRVLVDFARARHADKRGGDVIRVTLHDDLAVGPTRADDVVALDEALLALAALDERKSQVVELRFFGGLSNDETAAALGVSAKTVMRDWEFARAWLQRAMTIGSRRDS